MRWNQTAFIYTALGLAALGGCMEENRPGRPGPAPGRGTFFECDRGVSFNVIYRRNVAVVRMPGRAPMRLRQVPAASGTWYEGGGYSLREKGGEAIWSGPTREAPYQCRAVPIAR